MKVLHSHDAVIRILNEHLDLSDWPVQDVASLPCCDYPSRRHGPASLVTKSQSLFA